MTDRNNLPLLDNLRDNDEIVLYESGAGDAYPDRASLRTLREFFQLSPETPTGGGNYSIRRVGDNIELLNNGEVVAGSTVSLSDLRGAITTNADGLAQEITDRTDADSDLGDRLNAKADTTALASKANTNLDNVSNTNFANKATAAGVGTGTGTGLTTEQANEIAANTKKVGITQGQADAITDNTAKKGITQAQADAITANTAKKGITPDQETLITNSAINIAANTSGVSTNAAAIATKADTTALTAEATARANADTALGSRIDDEATARTTGLNAKANTNLDNVSNTNFASKATAAGVGTGGGTGLTTAQAAALAQNTRRTRDISDFQDAGTWSNLTQTRFRLLALDISAAVPAASAFTSATLTFSGPASRAIYVLDTTPDAGVLPVNQRLAVVELDGPTNSISLVKDLRTTSVANVYAVGGRFGVQSHNFPASSSIRFQSLTAGELHTRFDGELSSSQVATAANSAGPNSKIAYSSLSGTPDAASALDVRFLRSDVESIRSKTDVIEITSSTKPVRTPYPFIIVNLVGGSYVGTGNEVETATLTSDSQGSSFIGVPSSIPNDVQNRLMGESTTNVTVSVLPNIASITYQGKQYDVHQVYSLRLPDSYVGQWVLSSLFDVTDVTTRETTTQRDLDILSDTVGVIQGDVEGFKPLEGITRTEHDESVDAVTNLGRALFGNAATVASIDAAKGTISPNSDGRRFVVASGLRVTNRDNTVLIRRGNTNLGDPLLFARDGNWVVQENYTRTTGGLRQRFEFDNRLSFDVPLENIGETINTGVIPSTARSAAFRVRVFINSSDTPHDTQIAFLNPGNPRDTVTLQLREDIGLSSSPTATLTATRQSNGIYRIRIVPPSGDSRWSEVNSGHRINLDGGGYTTQVITEANQKRNVIIAPVSSDLAANFRRSDTTTNLGVLSVNTGGKNADIRSINVEGGNGGIATFETVPDIADNYLASGPGSAIHFLLGTIQEDVRLPNHGFYGPMQTHHNVYNFQGQIEALDSQGNVFAVSPNTDSGTSETPSTILTKLNMNTGTTKINANLLPEGTGGGGLPTAQADRLERHLLTNGIQELSIREANAINITSLVGNSTQNDASQFYYAPAGTDPATLAAANFRNSNLGQALTPGNYNVFYLGPIDEDPRSMTKPFYIGVTRHNTVPPVSFEGTPSFLSHFNFYPTGVQLTLPAGVVNAGQMREIYVYGATKPWTVVAPTNRNVFYNRISFNPQKALFASAAANTNGYYDLDTPQNIAGDWGEIIIQVNYTVTVGGALNQNIYQFSLKRYTWDQLGAGSSIELVHDTNNPPQVTGGRVVAIVAQKHATEETYCSFTPPNLFQQSGANRAYTITVLSSK